MVDEMHEQFKFTRDLMQHPDWQNVPFLGWSATPWSKSLGTYWNDLVVAATTAELIEAIDPLTGKPYLAPFRVFAPPSGIKPNLTNIPTSAQVQGIDYVVEQLSAEMSQGHLVADAVETWKAKGRGRPTLTFCVDRAHADKVHQQFCSGGVHAEYLDGNTPMDQRKAIRERVRRGETAVVVNIGVLTTGCDWPEVSCIQLLRPTKSEMLLVQIIGRGLRPSAGKDDCLILDHTTNTERLGFVTDIHHDVLDDGRPKGQRQIEAGRGAAEGMHQLSLHASAQDPHVSQLRPRAQGHQ
jgi:superfamily II DNA or RNA helicase